MAKLLDHYVEVLADANERRNVEIVAAPVQSFRGASGVDQGFEQLAPIEAGKRRRAAQGVGDHETLLMLNERSRAEGRGRPSPHAP